MNFRMNILQIVQITIMLEFNNNKKCGVLAHIPN